MLIDVTDEKSFPREMGVVITDYLSNLPDSVTRDVGAKDITYSVDVQCAIEDYLSPYKAEPLYSEVMSILHKCSIISYHATKVLNEEDILKEGLRANSWNWYSDKLTNVLLALSVVRADAVKAVDIIKKEYNRKYSDIGRTFQLCFFSRIDDFEMDDGTAGYDQFCESIGGELARWALEDKMPEIFERLKNNGKAVIVKVALPYTDLAGYTYENVAYQFISYFAAKYYWDFDYKIKYDCITEKDVSADKILELIPVTKEIDY